MDTFLLILFICLGICILLMILFTRKGEYITNSYKVNSFIDRDGCIELLICDQYLKKKSFFVNYKYSSYLESNQEIIVTFIQIPLIHRKPRIQDVYINKEKISNE